MNLIETDIWVPNPEQTGFLKFERNKTYGEVYEELVQFLKEQGVYDELDYLSNHMDKEAVFGEYRWIACFAVKGGSEGHFIHIETISDTGRELIFLGKTFSGLEHAMKISNLCTQAFYKH